LQLRDIARQHKYAQALLILTLCLKVISGYAEAQSNRSRLGQLIQENVEATDIAQQRIDAQLHLIADKEAS
jgi:hypothetical protein